MLYIIGLGLGDEKDITVRGLEAVKKCSKIYLEAYTSILGVPKARLEEFYGKPILEADRDKVEQEADEILEAAKTEDVAFLVVGDPFGATTHTDLVLRARTAGIPVEVIHNASIMNAIGCVGLQLYSFGHTVSIPFWTDSWQPDSFYDRIKQNKGLGLHTLCLLDIKVKEQSMENLLRGRKIYEPPRFMTVNQCIHQLRESEKTRGLKVLPDDALCIGAARVGQPTQFIATGTLEELADVDFGGPLHSFVVCGEMHPLEMEYFEHYRVSAAK
jgi:diphthine methyl ester synthase